MTKEQQMQNFLHLGANGLIGQQWDSDCWQVAVQPVDDKASALKISIRALPSNRTAPAIFTVIMDDADVDNIKTTANPINLAKLANSAHGINRNDDIVNANTDIKAETNLNTATNINFWQLSGRFILRWIFTTSDYNEQQIAAASYTERTHHDQIALTENAHVTVLHQQQNLPQAIAWQRTIHLAQHSQLHWFSQIINSQIARDDLTVNLDAEDTVFVAKIGQDMQQKHALSNCSSRSDQLTQLDQLNRPNHPDQIKQSVQAEQSNQLSRPDHASCHNNHASCPCHINRHWRITHHSPRTESQILIKSVLSGGAQLRDHCLVTVQNSATSTNTQVYNHALLLDNQSKVQAAPELEVYCEEVSCRHGATSGRIDDASLFYLTSRGIDPQMATQLMVDGFLKEILAPWQLIIT